MPKGVVPVGDRILVEFDEKPEVEDEDEDKDHYSSRGRTLAARVSAIGPEYGKKPKKDEGMAHPHWGNAPKLSPGDVVYVRCAPDEVFEAEGKFYEFVDPYAIQGVGGAAAAEMAGPKPKRKAPEPEKEEKDEEEEYDME